MVQVWYPALPSSDRAPYGTAAGGLKGWLYHHLVRTHSAREAVPSLQRSPLLVYVPAWGGERTENTALAEDLASHGYIVAAFDDVTRDSPALSRLAGAPDLSSERAYRETIQLANDRLAYETLRASAVFDYFAHLNARDPNGRFTGRIDLKHVGIFGYSLGGAVALETCRRDKRFLAAMNLDGLLFAAGSSYAGGVPYFLVSDTMPAPTAGDLASRDPAIRYMSELIVSDGAEQSRVLRYGGYELQVADTAHISFSDVPLYAPLQRFRAGWNNPPRVTSALRDYTLAFFRQALNGTFSPLLMPGAKGRPTATLTVGTGEMRR